jgi:hypothetical protein
VKVGDLIRHLDGEVGLLLELNWEADFPYKIFFPSTGMDWFSTGAIVEVVSENKAE